MKLRKNARASGLIGKMARVVSSPNASLIGLSGRIVDETKNTVVVESQDRLRRVLKGAVKLDIEGTRIDGKRLLRRPEDR